MRREERERERDEGNGREKNKNKNKKNKKKNKGKKYIYIYKKRTGCEYHQRSQQPSILWGGIWRGVGRFVLNLHQFGRREHSTVCLFLFLFLFLFCFVFFGVCFLIWLSKQ